MHTVHKQVGLKSAYVRSLQALIEKYTAQKTLHACITGEVHTTNSSYNINEFAIGHAKASAVNGCNRPSARDRGLAGQTTATPSQRDP
jgi:hypothetical protein